MSTVSKSDVEAKKIIFSQKQTSALCYDNDMKINWFPGHMNKAQKEIRKTVPKCSLIIEVLDARIPFSSENPLVAGLRGDTPTIKVLNKSDLADPKVTAMWIERLNSLEGVTAVEMQGNIPGRAKPLLQLGISQLPKDRNKEKPITTMILGIPNVGKSTIINTLAGRKIAKTGNKPAVTKQQQRINIEQNFVLLDTPGFLWPRLSPHSCGLKLAVSGAIKDAVTEFEDLAFWAVRYLADNYPNELMSRYNLEGLPDTEMEILEAIAGKRGCLGRRGVLNLNKVSQVVVLDYRQSKMGHLSLETPAQVDYELAHAPPDESAKERRKRKKLKLR